MKGNNLSLKLSGNTLDEIWEELIQQIAISSEAVLNKENLTIDGQLKTQDRIDWLNKMINKTESAAWKEQQPKKRFELYTQLQAYKNQLEEITNAKA